jgi:hypothetical protein
LVAAAPAQVQGAGGSAGEIANNVIAITLITVTLIAVTLADCSNSKRSVAALA